MVSDRQNVPRRHPPGLLRRFTRSALTLIAIGGVAPLPLFAQSGTAPPDTAGLGRLRDAWTAAYQQGRADDMRDLYTEDAVRMPYDAPSVEGRTAIVAAYEAAFTGRGATPRIALSPVDVLDRDGVVVERGDYDEQWLGPDGTVRYSEIGKYVSIARRGDDGRWRYEISIFNRDAPP